MKDKASKGASRRRFFATGEAAIGVTITGFPAVLRAQAARVKIRIIHPGLGLHRLFRQGLRRRQALAVA